MEPSVNLRPHELAIARIAQLIRENPDTSGGVQLRRFLWSLYNMHHVVNLWDLASRLSGEPAQLVGKVFQAALDGTLREDDIKRGLLIAGEMKRWEETSVPESPRQEIDGARQSLISALRRISPSYAHTELVRLTRKLDELLRELFAECRPNSSNAPNHTTET